MPTTKRVLKQIRLGICGCGAIGSRIAQSTRIELKKYYRLTALYDRVRSKTKHLAQELNDQTLKKNCLNDLLKSCDLMVEAVNPPAARSVIQQALKHKKNVLAMSVGRLLHAPNLLRLAEKHRCHLLMPSGAVSGIDAVKAASLKHISKIVLTTRKPLRGFAGNPYLRRQGICLDKIQGDTVIFEGPVTEAIKHFPQNINVAATLALASGHPDQLFIRLLTSPRFTVNSHEIEITGDFGRMISRTENTICPDNPKTSYLAVLSAIQTLKDFSDRVHIGT